MQKSKREDQQSQQILDQFQKKKIIPTKITY